MSCNLLGFINDRVAQLVEHVTFNDGVLGSNPSAVTSLRPYGLRLGKPARKKAVTP